MEALYLLSYGSKAMAPQARLELATDRLTADCSTTELLRNTFMFKHLDNLCKIFIKKEQPLLFILPGGVLLSQGETPNYHRR